MDFEQLFGDDRAVSPVIGVILMVAITVILAAVIGTFVLGLGDQVQRDTPRTSFGFDNGGQNTSGAYNVTVTHESGDTIDAGSLKVLANGTSTVWNENGGGDEVNAGSAFELVNADGSLNGGAGVTTWVSSGDTVRVVYDSPDSDSTATLAKYEVS